LSFPVRSSKPISRAGGGRPGRGDAPPEVRAAPFPARYRMHKYWGKKPGNVVAAYIEHFADPKAMVLDPFAGSGVVLAEALIARRRGIAVDLNPVASLLTRVTVEGADPAAVRAGGRLILSELAPLREALFAERCARCGARGEIIATAFAGDAPVRVNLDCPACGGVIQAPRPEDPRLVCGGALLPDAGEFPDGDIYPGWQMRKLFRAGLRRWSELFTSRNRCAVAHLNRACARVPDASIRRALTISFTAHLAQATRMIADASGRAGGPSWKINCYWLPRASRELNPFRYFENRVEKTAQGLEDMAAALRRPVEEGRDYQIWGMSTENIAERVPKGSIGYIFTDPPYGGEGIQYGELSMLWNLWLSSPMSVEREVAYNPWQQKDEADYAAGLMRCMAQSFEALAPGCWASITFANKDPRVWETLLRVCAKVGFELRSEASLKPSAPNITNIIAAAAPKADRILNFIKPIPRPRRAASPPRRPS
jgi:16S rRNA G966 N2-methylase RsmD